MRKRSHLSVIALSFLKLTVVCWDTPYCLLFSPSLRALLHTRSLWSSLNWSAGIWFTLFESLCILMNVLTACPASLWACFEGLDWLSSQSVHTQVPVLPGLKIQLLQPTCLFFFPLWWFSAPEFNFPHTESFTHLWLSSDAFMPMLFYWSFSIVRNDSGECEYLELGRLYTRCRCWTVTWTGQAAQLKIPMAQLAEVFPESAAFSSKSCKEGIRIYYLN